jgi:hypothetical protein
MSKLDNLINKVLGTKSVEEKLADDRAEHNWTQEQQTAVINKAGGIDGYETLIKKNGQ